MSADAVDENENKALVRRFFEVGPSRGDLRAARELLADDFALHVPLPCSPGVQGIIEVISACRAAFEHLDVTVEDMVSEGDRVAARFVARGIHQGDFMGQPATGRSITMTGIEIFRIENGRIAELWGEANLLGLMGQLGILPPSGGRGQGQAQAALR
ncbi:MAG TPA: ester cyclase [Methanothrix soehngenii]|nr:ester cyclase [Methanothrix soehngenii]